MSGVLLFRCVVLCAAAAIALAPASAADGVADPGWADRPISASLNSELPHWIQFGGEYRLRFEGIDNLGFRNGSGDFYFLNRVRLNMRIQPTPWLKLFVQGQDARVSGNQIVQHAPPYQDTFDLRQAYLEIGAESQPAALRVGRQEFIFGEERLVGASNWANTARSFDAVRLDLRHAGFKLTGFASSVVVSRDGTFDHHQQGNNLHGAYASIDHIIPKAKVEPFLFWRLNPRIRAENGTFGKLDTRTVGVRIAGTVLKRTAYVTEMAFQRGNSSVDSVSAWAGHWRIEQPVPGRWSPKVRVEYNYATGDRRPQDGRTETFDVLYPTPHDKYGLADQVGWKNVQHAAAIYEFKPIAKLTLQGKFHTWWLASERDGLYNAPGNLLVRDATGNSGRHVGEELDFQALSPIGKQVMLGGGVGHMFPGEFLQKASPGAGLTFPYVMLTYTF